MQPHFIDDVGLGGAVIAVGLRRLRTGYTGPLLRAAKASGAEADIGYDADDALDTGALLAFSAGEEVRVTKLYGQVKRKRCFH